MSTRSPRFSDSMRVLHWLMALLVLAAYVLVEQRGLFPRGSSGRATMMQGHYWVGLSILLFAFWRLVERLRIAAPPIAPMPPAWQTTASKILHIALYAFFIVMPLLGLATAWSDGKQVIVPFVNVALPALLPENRALAHQLESLHGTIGEAFYWVIGAHVVAALWHHFGRRDDTLRRMLW